MECCAGRLGNNTGLFCDCLSCGGPLCALRWDGERWVSPPEGRHEDHCTYICLTHSSLINTEGGGRDRQTETQGEKRARKEKRETEKGEERCCHEHREERERREGGRAESRQDPSFRSWPEPGAGCGEGLLPEALRSQDSHKDTGNKISCQVDNFSSQSRTVSEKWEDLTSTDVVRTLR